MTAAPIHVPVLPAEVLQWLDPRPGQIIVDGTLGGGGHTRLLAEKLADGGGFVVALDLDPAAVAAAERNLAGLPVKVAQANFTELPAVLDELKIDAVDGVLLDLGLSSDQLADNTRGFSFDAVGPLDLRFDPNEGEPAWQLLGRLPERALADLIYQNGEERFSHHRPIVAGDRLVGTLHVDSVRATGGHTMITTRVDLATEAGAPVSSVTSTIVVRA
jgi:16S rRNA (cytosine1402-N4)-methyltransferase